MGENYNDYALMFKALSDSNRLYILNYLAGYERCACEILEQLNITQSTLSYHMKFLTDTNIVNGRKEGKWMYYSLNTDKLEMLNLLLKNLLTNNTVTIPTLKCKN